MNGLIFYWELSDFFFLVKTKLRNACSVQLPECVLVLRVKFAAFEADST